MQKITKKKTKKTLQLLSGEGNCVKKTTNIHECEKFKSEKLP